MKHLSLASRYRPQTFSEVIGQHLAATALSRAAAEDRIAPAYLLSGTRGVGKTTIARIFAKALNCEKGPAAEPCNACRACAQITAGNHVDVNEIDGASNTGVDDVRALRENIGYLPMEGRYKIFIVDEAHMLSKNAFNALLKTLEEPPAHTVFIFATTEAHRFPATIISRCQHFVFRHLPEETIFGHLDNILNKENIPHEAGAVRLIARRAAGSARDSLSLLDQVLSLCTGQLDSAIVREALGLAGQEFFNELYEALAAGDCGRILELCGQLLHSGVDIGFFTRELSASLRNLFLFRQIGAPILPRLGLSDDEKSQLEKQARSFTAPHLHAAWQMSLESQRAIAQNPEPGSALELLLLNLAMLPRLLPVGSAQTPQGAMEPPKAAPRSDSEPPRGPAERGQAAPPEPAGQLRESAAGFMSSAPDWKGFCEFCETEHNSGRESVPRDILRMLNAQWQGDQLTISAPSMALWNRLDKKKPALTDALGRYCGARAPQLIFRQPQSQPTAREMLDECSRKPELDLCRRILDATITECSRKPGAGSAI